MYSKFLEIVSSLKKVILLTHPTPDPDAFGSVMALKLWLQENLKLDVSVYLFDSPNFNIKNFPNIYDYAIYNHQIILDRLERESDLCVIILDIGTLHRRLEIQKILNQKGSLVKFINIDHHINSGDEESKLSLNIVEKAKSTTTLLFRIFRTFDKFKISSDVAFYLLLGIYGDSEGFRDVAMDVEMFQNIIDLLELGADLDLIINNLERSISLSFMRAVSAGMLTINMEGNFAFVVLNNSQLLDIQRETGYWLDKADILNNIRNIDGIDFAFVIFEIEENKISVSLKSRKEYPKILDIAVHFGGGGHYKSCAFRYIFDTSFEVEKNKILSFIRNYV